MYRRTPPHRLVLIVEKNGSVVARQEPEDPFFGRFAGERLPQEVTQVLESGIEAGTYRLSDGNLLHVIPIKGSTRSLHALIIEELRERSAVR